MDLTKVGGIYCFFPFERLDEKNGGVFKIGNTQLCFQRRLEQYHTYFTGGLWVVALINVKPKRGKVLPKSFLNTLENYVMKEIEKNKGVIIVNKERIRNQGQTEFIYTNPYTVKRCFRNAVYYFRRKYKDFTFTLDTHNNLREMFIDVVNENYENNLNLKEKYLGEYIFNINKDDNKK